MTDKPKILTTSPLFDKYIVIKRENFIDLFMSLVQANYSSWLTENKAEASYLARAFMTFCENMHVAQGNRYFCLNLDEEEAEAALQTYYTECGYAKAVVADIMRKIHKPDIDRRIVFKHKAICSGVIIDEWIHPDDRKRVYDVRLDDGRVSTVLRSWIIKWLKEEEIEEKEE